MEQDNLMVIREAKAEYQQSVNQSIRQALSVSIKNWFMLSVRISSYGCTQEVWRLRKKSRSCWRRTPRATLAS